MRSAPVCVFLPQLPPALRDMEKAWRDRAEAAEAMVAAAGAAAEAQQGERTAAAAEIASLKRKLLAMAARSLLPQRHRALGRMRTRLV